MIALGLRIKTPTGDAFDVWGYVTAKNFPKDGKIYYCAGSSYPEACVDKVYSVDKTAEELYKMCEQQSK